MSYPSALQLASKSQSSIVERVEFRFRVTLVVTLLFFSLLGGFVWELSRGPTSAEALISPPPIVENWRSKLIVSPSGIRLLPVGKESQINGRPSESAVFQSDIDVKTLAQKIVNEWQKHNYLASGVAFSDRAAAFGISDDRTIRTSLGIWKNPTSGKIEGIISAARISLDNNNSRASFIPGLPIPQNAVLGATYKSSESEETSWSGSLTAKGSSSDVAEWFRKELVSLGWTVSYSPNKNFFQFSRKGQEVTLLFAEVPTESPAKRETFVSIIKKSDEKFR